MIKVLYDIIDMQDTGIHAHQNMGSLVNFPSQHITMCAEKPVYNLGIISGLMTVGWSE
jgi:hypothetical protein